MKNVGIIGYGEIGSSLHKVYQDFPNKFNVVLLDPFKDLNNNLKDCEIINICISQGSGFVGDVVRYIKMFNPDLTIIHSTIPVGTTDKIIKESKANVVHSPIRGVHPNLYTGIKTFKKYIGSPVDKAIELCYTHFDELGLYYNVIKDAKATELAKLLSTTYYGLVIAWHGEMKKMADKYGVDFSMIGDWTQTYNEGYKELKMSNVIRPNLYPPDGNIGGHCVIPNTEILKEQINSMALDLILEYK